MELVQGDDLILDPRGHLLTSMDGARVTYEDLGGELITIYADEHGTAEITQPLTTRYGRVEPVGGGGWWHEPQARVRRVTHLPTSRTLPPVRQEAGLAYTGQAGLDPNLQLQMVPVQSALSALGDLDGPTRRTALISTHIARIQSLAIFNDSETFGGVTSRWQFMWRVERASYWSTEYEERTVALAPLRWWRMNDPIDTIVAEDSTGIEDAVYNQPDLTQEMVTNPSGASSLTGYAGGSGGVLTQVTDGGQPAIKVANSTSNDTTVQATYKEALPGMAAEEGDVIQVTVELKEDAALTNGGVWTRERLIVSFYDEDGVLVYNDDATQIATKPALSGAFQTYQGQTEEAPPGTAEARLILSVENNGLSTDAAWRMRNLSVRNINVAGARERTGPPTGPKVAVRFAGGDDAGIESPAADLGFGNDCAVECWFSPEYIADGDLYLIGVSKADGTAPTAQPSIRVRVTSGVPQIQVVAGGVVQIETTDWPGPAAGRFHFVTFSRTDLGGGEFEDHLYVDGWEPPTIVAGDTGGAPTQTAFVDQSVQRVIGSNVIHTSATAELPFRGRIAEVAFYDHPVALADHRKGYGVIGTSSTRRQDSTGDNDNNIYPGYPFRVIGGLDDDYRVLGVDDLVVLEVDTGGDDPLPVLNNAIAQVVTAALEQEA